MRMQVAGILAMLLLTGMAPASVQAAGRVYHGIDLEGKACTIERGYGPFDYTQHLNGSKHLKIVEEHHFTRDVEALRKGRSGSIEEDLNYTLRAFPNHHRALYSIIRYALDERRMKQDPLKIPPECYLQRAVEYAPEDAKAPLLFGIYLHQLKKYEKAEQWYRAAIKTRPYMAEAHYNLGLMLVDMERLDEARKEAILAYRYGYPMPGLKYKLERAGYPLQ